MSFQFTKATKSQSRARIALIGPSGSGKTYSALEMARGLGERIAVIDTEHGSASKYADRFGFDVLNLEHHDPITYVKAIQAAEAAGYDVIVVDSLSHAWSGSGGALEQVDAAAKRSKGNSYVAWRDVTPKHNAMVNALVGCKAHLIVTMRAKTAYELQKDDKTGKVQPIKIGMAPIQRDGVEYEFDVVADIDLDHNLIVSKTRMSDLDGLVEHKPGFELGRRIADWLTDGEPGPGPAPQGAPEPEPLPAGSPARSSANGTSSAAASSGNSNGNGPAAAPQRPWDAATAVNMVTTKAELLADKMAGEESSKEQRQQIAIRLGELFGDAVRYYKPFVTRTLFGVDSTVEISQSQAAAYLGWLKSGEHVGDEALAVARLGEEVAAATAPKEDALGLETEPVSEAA
jgi:hypothetical protein